MPYEIAIVGVSAGGLNALCELLGALPADLAMALVLVQHRSRESEALCEVLQTCTELPVTEVLDKAPITAGRVYLAPPDYHVLVERGYFSLSLEEPVRFSRPSIDVAFTTAADAYGAHAIGVVLTGANADGSEGLRRLSEGGGYAIVQEPSEAEVAVMPRAAQRAVPTAEVLPLRRIGPRLLELQGERTAMGEPR